jgi:hypothetical protein
MGRLTHIVTIDVFQLNEKATQRIAADFLRALIKSGPYKIHTVLTDKRSLHRSDRQLLEVAEIKTFWHFDAIQQGVVHPISVALRESLRRRAAGLNEAAAAAEALAETVEINVDHGRDVEREQLRQQQAARHGETERSTSL